MLIKCAFILFFCIQIYATSDTVLMYVYPFIVVYMTFTEYKLEKKIKLLEEEIKSPSK